MMNGFNLEKISIDDQLFLDKLNTDLAVGVKINSTNQEKVNLIKVWTDSPEWQFVVIGLLGSVELSSLYAAEIQSTGQSRSFLRMKVDLKEIDPRIQFQKLAVNFAQVEEVSLTEAEEFVTAYLDSTFNRTLTGGLFDELAHDKDYFNWLIY